MEIDIKFCGLTRLDDADEAVRLGASYVGVIFAEGPRMLTADRARHVLADVPSSVQRVGVFADQPPHEISRMVDFVGLDVVQLHGASGHDRIAALRRETKAAIWSVLRVRPEQIAARMTELGDSADAVLLDAYVPGALGGTGVTLPWPMIADDVQRLRGDMPIILAGGLRPENVSEAIAAIGPDVVDVSSGVESAPGIKDHQRMRAFRDAVTHASMSR